MLDSTLYGILYNVEKDLIVLPAMQRPFVWGEDRIYRLMDSLLRGFPIGSLMLWRTSSVQRFRSFPRNLDTGISPVYNYTTSSENDNKYLVLDGQQRLTSLFTAFKGTYNGKRLYIDILSGSSEGKDPGNEYYNCKFLSETEVKTMNNGDNGKLKQHFVPIQDLIKIDPIRAATSAHKKATELSLEEQETLRISDLFIRCATILGNSKSLQIITVDQDPSYTTPVEEILEIFVRVNSGGLVLQKSDLLMSLLDLEWNNIQPELQQLVREINEKRPFQFTRDDVLKSLLLANGAETRFDKLVSDRNRVKQLAEKLPEHIPYIKRAWELLGVILMNDCKIYCERFFRGGHNALLPFVLFLSKHEQISSEDKQNIVIGIYMAIMSGIFSGAEARMGAFTRNKVMNAPSFPIKDLCELVRREYGITSLDNLLRRHLDLALNIAHGGITLDKNPEQLQRDHIFPKSKLEKAGFSYELINHYANFHFLRGVDNLNKSDKPPHEWFKNPGRNIAPYSEDDLKERLLTWDDLEPGHFESMLQNRGKRIRTKAEELFKISEDKFNALFGNITIHPSLPLAQNLKDSWYKGHILFEQKNYEEAIKYFNEAIEFDNKYHPALNSKGEALFKLGKYEESIENYNKVLKLIPNHVSAWRNKGDALYEIEKYQEAIDCYDKSLTFTPANSEIFNSKGLALYEIEKYQEAVECYDKALNISPVNSDILHNKGLALNEQRKYVEAIKCYDKALQIAPGDIDIWKNKAKALDNLGKHDEAKECYAKVAEMMKQ